LAGFVFQKRFKLWLNCDGRGPQLVDIITNCKVKLYEPGFAGFKDWQDLLFDNGKAANIVFVIYNTNISQKLSTTTNPKRV